MTCQENMQRVNKSIVSMFWDESSLNTTLIWLIKKTHCNQCMPPYIHMFVLM